MKKLLIGLILIATPAFAGTYGPAEPKPLRWP